MKFDNEQSEGMKRYADDYRRSKFLKMIQNEASNPTRYESSPYIGEKSQVQEEIRNAETGFNTAAYENMRMLDQEPNQYSFGDSAEYDRGNAIEAKELGSKAIQFGRTPQSEGSQGDDYSKYQSRNVLGKTFSDEDVRGMLEYSKDGYDGIPSTQNPTAREAVLGGHGDYLRGMDIDNKSREFDDLINQNNSLRNQDIERQNTRRFQDNVGAGIFEYTKNSRTPQSKDEPTNYVEMRPINVFKPNDEVQLSQYSALQEMKKAASPDPINPDTINQTVSNVIDPNEATKDYIKGKEGFRSVPYKDVGGNLTVGYGKNIQNMSPEQTQELYKGGVGKELDDRVSEASNFVEDYSQIPLTPKQKTAFVSLYDNAGPAVAKKAIDIFQTQGIEASQDYFRKIINSGGKPVQGLMNRRSEEAAMLAGDQMPATQQNQNQTQFAQQQNLARTNEAIGQGEGYAFAGHQEIQPAARNTMNVMDQRLGQVQKGIGGAPMPPSWESVGLGLNQNQAPAQAQSTGATLPQTKPVTPHQAVAQNQVKKAEEIAKVLPAQKDEVQDALNKLKESTMAAADLAAKGMHDLSLEQAKLADDQFKRLNDIAKIQEEAARKYQKTLDEIDTEVNRTRLWDNMPIGNKLVAALSLFAGAFTRDGQNRALQTFQSEIEKDLQNQKLEYERKGDKAKTAYAIAARKTNDELGRMQMARSIQAGLIEAKLSELKSSMIRPEAQKAIDTLQYQMEVAKKESIAKGYEKQVELYTKLMGAQYQAQRADYYKGMTEKNFAERSSRWNPEAVVRTKSLATSFDAIAPRRMEVIEMMDDLANQVQALSALKVSNPYYKREREVIKATIAQLAGRFAGIINDKTGGIVVKEADLAEDALMKLAGVDSLLNAATTPNGAIQRANDLRKISERVKDSARRSFDSAFMKKDGSTFTDEEKDSMLGFTKPNKEVDEW